MAFFQPMQGLGHIIKMEMFSLIPEFLRQLNHFVFMSKKYHIVWNFPKVWCIFLWMNYRCYISEFKLKVAFRSGIKTTMSVSRCHDAFLKWWKMLTVMWSQMTKCLFTGPVSIEGWGTGFQLSPFSVILESVVLPWNDTSVFLTLKPGLLF